MNEVRLDVAENGYTVSYYDFYGYRGPVHKVHIAKTLDEALEIARKVLEERS